MSVRVLIADDQELVRAGLRLILDAEDDIEVVAEARDGREALEQCDRYRVDVVLMDVRMPALDGVAATRRLLDDGRRGAPRVIVLTTYHVDAHVDAALQAGASGFLLKDVPPEQLVVAIRAVAAGDALLSPRVTGRLLDRFARVAPTPTHRRQLASLSAREREVLVLIAGGLSTVEIAAELVVGEATVKTHTSNVLRKLGLRDRAQGVMFAYESGLVEPGGRPGTAGLDR
ncbi:response regulator transcription factor [Georgenia yuyongxinii]|uniref:Response regulator transcription factor n=1 Tax=Georgenia yuyongxinii TaxID=2589797 RepID=A0A5B8C3D6_9MICO|nr:response regulator transcription factor [Georgenia yuyongxinii]QDC25034.1 response regulator transcription factor [Georgenia yuyongxinii]